MQKIPVHVNPAYKKRDCFKEATAFLDESMGKSGKILVLNGLRRTGKTTLMCQLAEHYGIKHIFEVRPNDTMEEVTKQLDEAFDKGERMVFLDEITNAKDFIYDSALLADYYASCGMDIIIAGTDSLGLSLVKENELFSRTKTVNMTYIPFAEHCKVLGTKDMDDYIRYGGLMEKGFQKNEEYSELDCRKYLDSAVAGNIARSLSKANGNKSYTEISKYSETDLTVIIQKIVELYNGTIEMDFLNKELHKASIEAPVKDAIRKTTGIEKLSYKNIDRKNLRKEYMDAVNLSCDLERPVDEQFIGQLEDALFSLNFLSVFETVGYHKQNNVWITETRGYEYYIIQPAIKHALLQEAKKILLNSPELYILSEKQRTWLANQIENDILGRMTENIVIFNTGRCLDAERYSIYKPYFKSEEQTMGEMDMLIYDKQMDKYYGFEIKHGTVPLPAIQDKHLLNPEIKEVMDKNYGNRENVCVLYNGNPFISDENTLFLDVSDFLISLYETKDLEKTIAIMCEQIKDNKENPVLKENHASEKNHALKSNESIKNFFKMNEEMEEELER